MLLDPAIKQAIFDIKTFKSSTAEITFTSNTAVRPVEIYRHGGTTPDIRLTINLVIVARRWRRHAAC